MIYGYIRVSSDKQTTENQHFEISNYSKANQLHVGEWIEETISATKKLSDRKFGKLLNKMQQGDILIVTGLLRLGRNLMQTMSIFGFSAEIGRNLISQGSKEALARKKSTETALVKEHCL